MDDEEIELAWAAGFYDGEGCATTSLTRQGARHLYVMVKQNTAADGGVPDTLVRFANAVGVGKIGGPYRRYSSSVSFNPNQQPGYMWYAQRENAERALSRLWPHLGRAKREQAEAAIAEDRRWPRQGHRVHAA